jgi:asparagine synthase (glutamine-hydrolysing)
MCGIAGIYHRDGAPPSGAALKAMTDAIAHRGPDGEGQFVENGIGLGHRRLAIIDLSAAGRQPMTTRDGRYVLSYNGEIYNFQELRRELEARGHQFRSRTDSEVLLYGLQEWGPALLPRLNGMFAFLFWDRQERRLIAARDRYGIKPLYVADLGGTVLFGSEVKAIIAHPEYRAAIDLEALAEYLTFQNFFTDRTLFKDVRLLPAGCWLDFAEGAAGASLHRYWDYQFVEPEKRLDHRDYLDELDRLFRQAVSRQLVSDVPLGSYLSGGTDSGAITMVAAPQRPHFWSFTGGFDLTSASGIELNFDERRAAEQMAYLAGSEHYEVVLKAGDMERVMPRLVRHIEEPRVGQSYPNFYVAQLASKFVKVVLSGTGGDELFGGYPWRYYRAVVNDDFEHYIDKYYQYWQRLIPNRQLKQVLRPVAARVEHVWTRDIFRNVFASHAPQLTRPEDYVNHSLYLEAKTFLHGLLVVEDKISMAHGLETRVPFLDNDLVDFALQVPADLKLGQLGEVVRLNENEPGEKTARYFQQTRDGKLLLRQMMARHVPSAVAEREKQGFSAPDASWFKGESIDYVRRVLYRRGARIWEVLDRDAVLGMVDDHLEGRQNRRLLIWSLLHLENWFAEFLS